MEAEADYGNLRCHERSSARMPVAMEYQQPRITMSSSTTRRFRLRRLLTVQDVVLEYSWAIVVLECFLPLSLYLRVFRDFAASQNKFLG